MSRDTAPADDSRPAPLREGPPRTTRGPRLATQPDERARTATPGPPTAGRPEKASADDHRWPRHRPGGRKPGVAGFRPGPGRPWPPTVAGREAARARGRSRRGRCPSRPGPPLFDRATLQRDREARATARG